MRTSPFGAGLPNPTLLWRPGGGQRVQRLAATPPLTTWTRPPSEPAKEHGRSGPAASNNPPRADVTRHTPAAKRPATPPGGRGRVA